jgi:hypothetical protein
MSHEFRPDRLQIRREDRWPKIGPFPQGKDFQSHDACPILSFSLNPPILHAVLKFETLHVIACDKREAFAQGSEATKHSTLPQAVKWIASLRSQ